VKYRDRFTGVQPFHPASRCYFRWLRICLSRHRVVIANGTDTGGRIGIVHRRVGVVDDEMGDFIILPRPLFRTVRIVAKRFIRSPLGTADNVGFTQEGRLCPFDLTRTYYNVVKSYRATIPYVKVS